MSPRNSVSQSRGIGKGTNAFFDKIAAFSGAEIPLRDGKPPRRVLPERFPPCAQDSLTAVP